VLHRIERTGGADLSGRDDALSGVRAALERIQTASETHPALEAVMEAVAGSLGKVHALVRYTPAPVDPPIAPMPVQSIGHAPTPSPAAEPPRAPPQASPFAAAAMPVAAHPAPIAPQPAYAQPAPQPAYAQPAPQPAYAQPAPQAPVHHAPQAMHTQPMPHAQQQPAPAQRPAAAERMVTPFTAVPAGTPADRPAAAPQPAPAHRPSQPQVPAQRPSSPASFDVELGIHSPSNFYKGLGGNDVIEHGGIFVATYKIPKIGATVNLRVLLPGDYEFHAAAVVQWVREPGGSDPGFGARFTQISQEGRQLVYRYTRNREPMFYDDL
jgi:hypothetical protein